jgi:hypothetical protein
MSEHDMFRVNSRMPRKVRLGDICVRDGFQHEESWIPTEAKIYYLQELALAGVKRLEATNLGNPRVMPQFKDAEDVLKGIREELFVKRLMKSGIKPETVEWTAVMIQARGKRDQAQTAGDWAGSRSHDGLHRRAASLCQQRHDPSRVLEGSGKMHQEMQRCWN